MDNQVINKRVSVSACKPHPRNYNTHDDGQVEDLRESLRQFGQVRSIVVQATKKPSEYLIVAGHGVTEAARREGIKTLKADIIPAAWRPARVLAYLAADNELARRGNPDEAQLAAIVAEVQQKEGDALARLAAGTDLILKQLLARGTDRIVNDPLAEWSNMPEFSQEDLTAYRSIHVHFADQEAIDRFAKIIGQKLTDKTRSIWYPETQKIDMTPVYVES